MDSESYWSKVNTEGLQKIFLPGDVEERPPTNREHFRLLNHPICPFAERARVGLAAKHIKFQEANIDLNHKPPYFVEAGGLVPVLELKDGKYLAESFEIIKWADENSTEGPRLFPKDEVEKAQQDEFIKKIEGEGTVGAIFKAFKNKEKDAQDKLLDFIKLVEEELSKNDPENQYLNNQSNLTAADVLFAPLIVRVVNGARNKNRHSLEGINLDDFPSFVKYYDTVNAHEWIGPQFCPKQYWYGQDIKQLPYPFDTTPYEDTQSLKTLKVLDGLTAKPRTNENYLRLYGHPLCPFVERALLVLHAKGVQYQFCGIDLTVKNKWHLDINGGLVPFLEPPGGEIVIESLDVADWVQDYTTDGLNLYPGGDEDKQLFKEQIASLSKIGFPGFMSFFKKESREGDGPSTYVKALEGFNEELEKSSTDFFTKYEQETMVDLMVFPVVHRLLLLKESQLKEKFYDQLNFDKIAKLTKWYNHILETHKPATANPIDFSYHLDKQIEADGPKVQLFYPIPSEA